MSIAETDRSDETREDWLARAPVRSPEMGQARFGGAVPPAAELDLADINPLHPHLFREHRWHDHFARLRREDPVHLNEMGSSGRYWSVTRWEDIRTIEADWNTFSSARGITLGPPAGTKIPESIERVRMFIAMDPPEHTQQRKTVRDVAALDNVRNLEPLTRERMGDLLDSLPEDETFDWVPTVSKELTAMMLATLFGIPHEDRHKLIRWSDVATSIPEPGGVVESGTQRREELMECLDYFTAQWERRRADPGYDLVSMLVHGDATKHLSPLEQLGNLMLLIGGGNDTTRNTMSGSVYALNRFPEQYDRLLADHSLVDGLVPEIIRWQTPLAYMRRTATTDTEFLGRKIAKGEQVLLWYVSANRDESFFDDPDSFDLTRENARRHLSFGTSIHHCMGNRVAEMQIRVLWEEILKRFSRIEVVDEPERTFSSFINGYVHLPVRVHRD